MLRKRTIRKRKSSRELRKIRFASGLFGILSFAAGLILVALWRVQANPRLRFLAIVYLGVALIFFGVKLLAEIAENVRFKKRAPELKEPAKDGFALLFVLLLMALLAGITVESQVLSRLALKHGSMTMERTELKLAVLDALCSASSAPAQKQAMKPAEPEPIRMLTPAGIETETQLTPVSRSALPAFVATPAKAKQFFMISASAVRGDMREEQAAFACGDGKAIRLLAWCEPSRR